MSQQGGLAFASKFGMMTVNADPEGYDTSVNRANGSALGNLYTGQQWVAIGSNPPKYVTAGNAQVPALTYGVNPPAAGDEFFASADMGSTIVRGGGRFRLRSTGPTTINGKALLGCWNGDANNLPVHIVLTNYQYYVSYILNGVEVAVNPDNGPAAPADNQYFPMSADSVTVYGIAWALDLNNSRLYVRWPDGVLQSYTDPHFSVLAANCTKGFFEGQVPAVTDAVFEWLSMYLGTSIPVGYTI